MKINQDLKPAGVFTLQHFRDGIKIGDDVVSDNEVVTQGLDMIADVCFNGETAPSTLWYLALYGNNVPVASTWTAANVAANSGELNTEISEANRPTWTKNTSVPNTGASSSNSENPAAFTMAQDDTIYGAFIVSTNSKAGTAGTLLAATKFTTSRAVLSSDEIRLTYEIQLTSS